MRFTLLAAVLVILLALGVWIMERYFAPPVALGVALWGIVA